VTGQRIDPISPMVLGAGVHDGFASESYQSIPVVTGLLPVQLGVERPSLGQQLALGRVVGVHDDRADDPLGVSVRRRCVWWGVLGW
jgi:hypothetical protein